MRVPQTERAQSAEEFFGRLPAHVDDKKEPSLPSGPVKTTRTRSGIRPFVLGNNNVPMVERFLLKVAIPARPFMLFAKLVTGRKD